MLSALPLPGTPGAGALVKLTCPALNASTGDCGATQLTSSATAAAALNAVAPGKAPFAAPLVFSYVPAAPIAWSDGTSVAGFFGAGLSTDTPFGTAPHRFPMSFSGYIAVPAKAGGTVKSFAVGSDDGYALAISDGTTARTSTLNGLRAFTFGDTNGNPLTLTFPASGGLFPFYLLYWENQGGHGVQLAWADGNAAVPVAGNFHGYSLVPATSLYAPDVRVSTWFDDLTNPGGTIGGSDALQLTVKATNQGTAPLGPHTLTLPVPTGVLSIVTPYPAASGCAVTSAGGVDTLTCTGLAGLAVGASETLLVRVTLLGQAAGTSAAVQPVISGPGTAPEVVQAVATLAGINNTLAFSDVFALGSDAANGALFSQVDSGNAPAALVGAGGRSDDDATRILVGAQAPGAPVITAPAASVPSTQLVSIAGTSPLPPGTTISVTITGAASAACSPSPAAQSDGSWACQPLALTDGSYSAIARAVNPGGAQGEPSAARAFTVARPAAPTLTAPAQGAVLAQANVLFSGTSGEAPGAQVRVTVAGSSTKTCNATIQADGSYACALSLPDGGWTAQAQVIEASAALGPSSAATTFTVNTSGYAAPQIAQTQTPSNATQVTFTGTVTAAEAAGGFHLVVREGNGVLCTVSALAATSWSCTSGALSEGAHAAVAIVADASGNTSPASNIDSFVLDRTAPGKPTIDAVPSPGTNTQPAISGGNGEAGATVSVCSDAACSTVLCTSPVSGGRWSCQVPPLQPDGQFTLFALQTDAATNRSAAASVTFTVDTQAPPAPVLVAPASPTNNPTPLLSGKEAEAGTTITVRDGTGRVLCTVLNAPAAPATWSCTSAALGDGDTSITATAGDAAGNVSNPSAAVHVLVDTVAPAAPTLAQTKSPGFAQTPLFSGSAEPFARVQAKEGNALLCASAPAGSDGSWSCTSTVLAAGPHTVNAFAVDAAGNRSGRSNDDSFTIDTTTPVAPTIDPLPVPPGGQAGFTPSQTPNLTGTGTSGDTLHVRLVGTNNDVCSGVPVAAGRWSCVTVALDPDTYTVEALQATPAGKEGPASQPRTFTVDPHKPAPPALDQPASPTNNTRPTVTGTAEASAGVSVADAFNRVFCTATASATDGTFSCRPLVAKTDGDYLLTATATTRAGIFSDPSAPARLLSIDSLVAPTLAPLVSPTRNTAPLFSGTGQSGTTVSVFSGSTRLCLGVVSGGKWSCQHAGPLADGTYLVVAQESDNGGHFSPPSAPQSLTIDTVAPLAPVLDAPATPTNHPAPVLGGSAEALSRVAVLEVSTGATVCSATTSAEGGFQCAPSSPLAEGAHQLTASATDAAGNVSPLAAAVSLVVVTTPPAAPAIVPTRSPTNAPRPALTGTSDRNTTVTVSEGSVVLCQARTSPEGHWSCTPVEALRDGAHQLTATALDAAGNSSAPSAADGFVVDTLPPAAPVLAPVPALSAVQRPIFTGRAEPLAAVTILAGAAPGAAVLCQTAAAADGTFSCASAVPLQDGAQVATAFATDVAGNAGPLGNTISFGVQGNPPGAPLISAPAAGAELIGSSIISGSAEPGASVTILIDGQPAGRAVADENGNFQVALSLSPGAHSVAAIARDQAGNVGPASAAISFTVDQGGKVRGGGCASSGAPSAGAILMLLLGALWPRRRKKALLEGQVEAALAARLAQGRAAIGQPCGRGADEEPRGLAAPEARLEQLLQLAHEAQEARRLAAGAREVAARLGLGPEVARAQLSILVEQRALEVDDRREHLVDLQHPFLRPPLDGVRLHLAEREVVALDVEPLGGLGRDGQRRDSFGDELGPELEAARLQAAEEVDLVLFGHEERKLGSQGLAPLRGGKRSHQRRGLEEPGHVGLGQIERVLQRLQDAELARIGDPVCERDGRGQPEGQLARGLVGQPLGERRQQVHQIVGPGDLLGGVGDGGLQIGGMDAVELGPLEDAAVDLLDLGLGDFSVGHRGQHHGLEERGLPRGVSEVNVLAARHAALLEPGKREFRLKERGMSIGACAAFALLLSGLAAGAARAQAPAIDLAHLRPSSGGDGLLGVEGARPLLSGEGPIELKLTVDGAFRPLVFVSDAGGEQALVKNRFGGTLTAQVHLVGPLSLAAQLPTTLGESGNLSTLPASARGPSSLSGGLGDLRLTPRLSILRQEWTHLLDLSAQASVELPTAKADTLTGDDRVTGELLVAAARSLELPGTASLELLGNLYGRLRPPRQLLDVKTGNELGLRAGVALYPGRQQAYLPLRVFAELDAQSWLRGGLGGSSPAEWRAGASFCAVRSLLLEAGGGGAIGHGAGTPAARLLVSIGYSPSACGRPVAALESVATPPPPEAAVVVPLAPAPAQSVAAAPAPPAPAPVASPAQPAPPPALPELPPVPADAPPPSLPDLPLVADASPPAPSVKLGGDAIELGETVRFQPNKAAIDKSSFALLDQVARVLSDHPELTLVRIEGHTDNSGSPATNRKLSQARAKAVLRYLVKRGIDPRRLQAKGFGADKPLAPNFNQRNRELNRRVELKVIERKEPGTPAPG